MSLSRNRDPSIVVIGEQGPLGSKIMIEMGDESVTGVTEGFGVADSIHYHDKYMFRLVSGTIVSAWNLGGNRPGGSVKHLNRASKKEEQCQRNDEQKKGSSPRVRGHRIHFYLPAFHFFFKSIKRMRISQQVWLGLSGLSGYAFKAVPFLVDLPLIF